MEAFKEEVQGACNREEEYKRVIRGIKRGTQIYSCSHTLKMLSDGMQEVVAENERLRGELEGSRNECYKLQ